jgi:hypothetical protein
MSYMDVIYGRFSNLETVGPHGPYQPYRIALEGVWKVPETPFQPGFSANIGPRAAAGDDLRFFFGARFDVAKLMGQLQQFR